MAKKNVVVVTLKSDSVSSVLEKLNLKNAKVVATVTGSADEEFTFGEKKIPNFFFMDIKKLVKKQKESLWLIEGEFRKLKKFLTVSGVPESNLIALESLEQSTQTWSENVRYVEKNGADFIATGNEYMQSGLNLECIPSVHTVKNFSRGGANLACAGQDLNLSYKTAKRVFEHVKPGVIKFVLIGLSPESFRYEAEEPSEYQELLKPLPTSEQADLNCENFKASLQKVFNAESLLTWEDEAPIPSKEAIEKNIQILKDYIELCFENDAQPVGVVFPFAPVARKYYNQELLSEFREIISQLESEYNFLCVDMFELDLGYGSFSDMTHLNDKGRRNTNGFLSMKLYQKKILPVESFCDMTYEYLHALSNIAPKDEYNALMARIFESSAQLIRRKEKIKIAFALYLSAQWCGDELYHLFANDERFETTVFLCMRIQKKNNNELFEKDFRQGVEQLKSHNLNVVPVEGINATVPTQDVIIYLNPYFGHFPKCFRAESITPKTLTVHWSYAFDIGWRGSYYHNLPLFHVAWKLFFPSNIAIDVYDKKSIVGVPRSFYSGYPRMDIFFDKNINFQFDWKMTRPDAKKIIWAPHWSIASVEKQATFQWNYQFIYEFAKAHPEISWVLKPHPGLFFAAVQEGVFPSLEAFKEYLQKWDDLPNAMVYTGAYYQAIFATSDGMIHDSCSFIGEYQYVQKPMIFLTRDNTKFNDLGNMILDVSYLVEGKDLEGIVALMQRVFVEGDDYKAAERKEVYDKYLNYPEYNGMLASEFIYKNIADELKKI